MMKKLVFDPLDNTLQDSKLLNKTKGKLIIKDSERELEYNLTRDELNIIFQQPFDMKTVEVTCTINMYDDNYDPYTVNYFDRPNVDENGTATLYCCWKDGSYCILCK